LSNLTGVEIAFEYTDDNDEDEEDDDEDEDEDEDGEDNEDEDEDEEDEDGEGAPGTDGTARPVYITREQIMQLLGHAGLGRIFASDFTPRGARRRDLRAVAEDDDDESEEEDDNPGTGYDPVGPGRTLRSRRPRGRAAFNKVPSEEGTELMNAGTFGSSPRSEDTIKRKKRLAYDIMRRSLGLGSEGRQKNSTRLLKQDMIPESVADTIIHYNARCYSGQFSDDGNFFFSCAQDFKVRMYDTSNPYDWKYYKVTLVTRSTGSASG
jgi:WD repeat-containing protein 23